VILSGALVAAQQNKTAGQPSTGNVPGAATAYRGCLGPGSTPDTFVLTKAKEQGQKSKEKISLIVVPAEKVKLDFYLLKEVEITGTVKGTVSGSEETGQVLPTLTATKVKTTSDYCG
jgi:hypothetical protein